MKALQTLSVFNKSQTQQLTLQIPWIKELSTDIKEQIIQMIDHGVYDTGHIIYPQGKPICTIGVISRGTLKCEQSLGDQQTVIQTLGPGETFATMSLLTGQAPAQYKADSLLNVMWLPGDKIKTLMTQDPKLAAVIAALIQT